MRRFLLSVHGRVSVCDKGGRREKIRDVTAGIVCVVYVVLFFSFALCSNRGHSLLYSLFVSEIVVLNGSQVAIKFID
jgi:hypothetical protein